MRTVTYIIVFALGFTSAGLLIYRWAEYRGRADFEAAQVHMGVPPSLVSASQLETPWIPELSGRAHDDWVLMTIDGRKSSLGDFRGKAVFLNFWSSSCGPCLAEMPSIEQLYLSLQGQNVAFLAVAWDNKDKLRKFLRTSKIIVPVYLSETRAPADLAVNSLPTTVILDTNGAAVFRHTGALNWNDEQVRTYLQVLSQKSQQHS